MICTSLLYGITILYTHSDGGPLKEYAEILFDVTNDITSMQTKEHDTTGVGTDTDSIAFAVFDAALNAATISNEWDVCP